LDIQQPTHTRRAAVTFTSTDATPTIAESSTFITAGTTAITDFDDGEVGDTILILAASTITITHGSPISLKDVADYNMVSGDTLTLAMYNDQVWEEIARTRSTPRTTVTFTSTDATPTIAASDHFITAGTTAITDFDDGKVGDVINILAASSITITHGSPISLKHEFDYLMLSGDTLTLEMFNDQVWEETGRTTAAGDNFLVKTEAVGAFTNTLVADESGKTIFLDLAGGGSTVLPAVAAGLEFTFIVSTAPTTAYTIDTPSGANIMSGYIIDILGASTTALGVYATARDIISFVATTSLIGDRLDIICDGTNWYYIGHSGADGGMTTGQT